MKNAGFWLIIFGLFILILFLMSEMRKMENEIVRMFKEKNKRMIKKLCRKKG